MRYLLSFLPENNLESAPYFEPEDSPERMDEELATLVPDSPQRPYDIRRAIELTVDDEEFFEVQEGWAQNLVVGFARLGRAGYRSRREPAGCVGRDAGHRRERQGVRGSSGSATRSIYRS